MTTPDIGTEATSPSYNVNTTIESTTTTAAPENSYRCPDNVQCNKLGGDCIVCQFNKHCFYGKPNETSVCEVKENIDCLVSCRKWG